MYSSQYLLIEICEDRHKYPLQTSKEPCPYMLHLATLLPTVMYRKDFWRITKKVAQEQKCDMSWERTPRPWLSAESGEINGWASVGVSILVQREKARSTSVVSRPLLLLPRVLRTYLDSSSKACTWWIDGKVHLWRRNNGTKKTFDPAYPHTIPSLS